MQSGKCGKIGSTSVKVSVIRQQINEKFYRQKNPRLVFSNFEFVAKIVANYFEQLHLSLRDAFPREKFASFRL